jgi:hypothetical protein
MCLSILGHGLILNSCNLNFWNFDNKAKLFKLFMGKKEII